VLLDARDNFKEFRTLIGHSNMVTSVIEFGTNMIITSSLDQSVVVWDLSQKKGAE
jgi:WD40 repeat protein